MKDLQIETVVIDKYSLEMIIERVVRQTMKEVLKGVAVTTPVKNVMTVKEASAHYKVPPSTIRKWVNDGRLKGEKKGKYLYIKVDEEKNLPASLKRSGRPEKILKKMDIFKTS